MSGYLSGLVWNSSPYEGKALLLHLAFADFANDGGEFFGSQPVLARKARCSEEFVRVTVGRMVEDGYLVILKRGSSVGRATEFRLLGLTDTPQAGRGPQAGGGATGEVEPPNSTGPTPQVHGSNPPSLPRTNETNNGNYNEKNAAGDAVLLDAPGALTDGQRVKALGDHFHAGRPTAAWKATSGVLRTFVKHHDDDTIRRGLDAVLAGGWPLSNETLRRGIEGPPVQRPRHGGMTPAEILALREAQ